MKKIIAQKVFEFAITFLTSKNIFNLIYLFLFLKHKK